MSYGRARAPSSSSVALSFLARDEFDQAAGAATGKTLPVGGAYTAATGSDTDDFQIGSGVMTRSSVGDSGSGAFAVEPYGAASRLLYASTPTPAGVLFAIDVLVDLIPATPTQDLALGFAVRYDSANRHGLSVRLVPKYANGKPMLFVIRHQASSSTLISYDLGSISANAWYSIAVGVDASGGISPYFVPQGQLLGEPLTTIWDSAFATGGALATGKIGPYDQNQSGTAYVRKYDNLRASPLTAEAALFANRAAHFLHDRALRENAAGLSEGRVPVFEGEHLKVPPATRAGYRSRLVVKARRLDVDSGLPDQGLTDATEADLVVTPRVVLLSKP